MIRLRKSEQRGHANHGWLNTYHTFSFAGYYDPEHMGFDSLRVLNQDVVQPGAGFETHSHRDMEIVSYVLRGALEHADSTGHGSRVPAGDFQLMSAGSGITHSEFNASKTEPMEFLQMWIKPKIRGTEPRYEQKSFPLEQRHGELHLIASPNGQGGSLTIGQDVRLYAGLLETNDEVEHQLAPIRTAWVQVARGQIELNGIQLEAGDGASIQLENALRFRGIETAEFLLWELNDQRESEHGHDHQ